MMRSLLKVLVLKETADSVWNNKDLYGDCVTIGIFEKNDTPPFRTALEITSKTYEKTDYGYLVNHKLESNQEIQVPIRIEVIKDNLPFLNSASLDSKLYNYEYYFLPNPFKDYQDHEISK